jgi:predicted AlkP superfamily phosphohydrolase/phosphomutase
MIHYKFMVVGLDGATFDLIQPWASAGKLPTFARLMAKGSWGYLQSTIPPMTAPAWTSFMTGKNPGKHGLYDWIQRHSGSYEVFPVTAAHCQAPAIWSLLSKSGRRVCILNVPMTFPPSQVNGLMISGLPAPSTLASITYPEDLLRKIERETGPYLLYPDPGQAYSDSGVDAFLERLYCTTENRFRVMDYLRMLEPWDFFMLVLNGTDTVQHAMWKFMDPNHPLHDPKKAKQYGDAILHFFQYVDSALDRLLKELDRETILMLMSDHGFGPFHKFIHVNNWLREQGWLQLKRNPKARLKSALFDSGFTPMKIYDLFMRVGMGAFKREVVRGRGQGLLRSLFLSFEDVDWLKSCAYSLGNVGQIRLNVKGREPWGVVEPGEQYEYVRETIIKRLVKLCDPTTGERVVEKIYRREEIYCGPKVDQAADIIFIPTRLEYFGFGEYEFGSNEVVESMKRGISGTHRLNGMILLYGEPIRSDTHIEGARLIDLAPTVLYLMGEPIPTDMDGCVIRQALLPEYADLQQIQNQFTNEVTLPPLIENELSELETQVITDRLRNLGYVG